MIRIYLILTLLVISPYTYSQFNHDSKKVEKLKIKSITIQRAKYIFDQRGRLIEYWYEGNGMILEKNTPPLGELNKFKIDTLGRFTENMCLDFNPCTDTICDPDTISYYYWKYTDTKLDSHYSWDYGGDYGNTSSLEWQKYTRKSYGDTVVEKLWGEGGNNTPKLIYIKITIDLKPKRQLHFLTRIPYRFINSDSARFFIDSTNYGSNVIIDYKKNGRIKKINSRKNPLGIR